MFAGERGGALLTPFLLLSIGGPVTGSTGR